MYALGVRGNSWHRLGRFRLIDQLLGSSSLEKGDHRAALELKPMGMPLLQIIEQAGQEGLAALEAVWNSG